MKFEQYLAKIFLRTRDRELWLRSPNRDLEGASPNDYIDGGRTDEVFKILRRQLGNVIGDTPGAG